MYCTVGPNAKSEKWSSVDLFMSYTQSLKGYSHKNKQSGSAVHVCKHKTSTSDKGADLCRSALLANQHGGYDRCVQREQAE